MIRELTTDEAFGVVGGEALDAPDYGDGGDGVDRGNKPCGYLNIRISTPFGGIKYSLPLPCIHIKI
jgi:hypothetical protein